MANQSQLLVQMRRYPSKVLLFGEYTVLFGGQALAIPYQKYTGEWLPDRKGCRDRLADFFNYLDTINSELTTTLDPEILTDLADRWIYRSNIPMGMGLGSSGALSASIYERAGCLTGLSLESKKSDLALIESFFHGKSSGFDALISLENQCLVQTTSGLIPCSKLPDPNLNIFLVYTRATRNARALIDQFQLKCRSSEFKTQMERLASLSNILVEGLLNLNLDFGVLQEVSLLQYEYLNFLIIPEIKEIWQKSLNDPRVTLKLCGAGGGGCYLLFTAEDQPPFPYLKFEFEKINL